MYPLSVVTVGCKGELLPQVRRELLNLDARLEAEFPDVSAAMAALRPSQREMRVFILSVDGPAELPELKRLSGTFVGRPVLTLMPGGDPRALVQALHAGAAQIVPLPFQPADFKEAMNCIAVQFSRATGTSKVVAVAGVTGGCGATTLAVNLGYEIADRQATDCVLLELALRMGVVYTNLNLKPDFTLWHLLKDTQRVDAYMVKRALTPVRDNFAVLGAPATSLLARPVPTADVLQVVDFVRGLAKVVVLDVPCTYDELYFKALAAADEVILVAEQTVPSIRALGLIRDQLDQAGGMRELKLVINRYDARVKGFVARDLEEVLGVSPILTVARHDAVTAAVNNGRPLRLEAPGCHTLADIDELAQLLAGPEPAAQARAEGLTLFGRLVHSFGLA